VFFTSYQVVIFIGFVCVLYQLSSQVIFIGFVCVLYQLSSQVIFIVKNTYCRLSSTSDSFIPSTIKMWNSLNYNIRNVDTLSKFKSELKKIDETENHSVPKIKSSYIYWLCMCSLPAIKSSYIYWLCMCSLPAIKSSYIYWLCMFFASDTNRSM
jgi:hypothetical protein